MVTAEFLGYGKEINARMISCPDCDKPVGFSGGTPNPAALKALQGVKGQTGDGVQTESTLRRQSSALSK